MERLSASGAILLYKLLFSLFAVYNNFGLKYFVSSGLSPVFS